MRKLYIVWNSDKSEGVVFRDEERPNEQIYGTVEDDVNVALYCSEDTVPAIRSSLSDAFVEIYGEDERHLEVLEIE